MKNEMTLTTKKALLKSIEHWHQNLNMLILNYLAGQNLRKDIHMTQEFCALCKLFNIGSPYCIGCPVNENDQHTWCEGTPYDAASDWLEKWYDEDDSNRETDFKEGFRLISKELEFLYSLLAE
jgi:hypothetical protein